MLTLIIPFIKKIAQVTWDDVSGKNGAFAQYVVCGMLGCVLVAIICAGYAIHSFFSPSQTEQNIDDRKPEIVNAQVNSDVKTAETNQAESKAQDSQKRVQNASKERETTIKRDSKEYSNTNAGQRFCDRFPDDSTCK